MSADYVTRAAFDNELELVCQMYERALSALPDTRLVDRAVKLTGRLNRSKFGSAESIGRLARATKDVESRMRECVQRKRDNDVR